MTIIKFIANFKIATVNHQYAWNGHEKKTIGCAVASQYDMGKKDFFFFFKSLRVSFRVDRLCRLVIIFPTSLFCRSPTARLSIPSWIFPSHRFPISKICPNSVVFHPKNSFLRDQTTRILYRLYQSCVPNRPNVITWNLYIYYIYI